MNPEHKKEIIRLYIEGKSPTDLTLLFPYKRTTIKECVRRAGVIRTQSEASSLAVKLGKKDKAISALIVSAKGPNRFNPAKCPWADDPTKHPRWKKDRSQLKQKRMIMEEKKFFIEMIKNNNFTCQITSKSGTLSVHHIKGVWQNPEMTFDKSNCVVVLKKIHKKFHKMYGYRTNEIDWDEFIKNKEYEDCIVPNIKRRFVPFEDKTNKRYGRLIVIYKDGQKWKCKCDCGNEVSVTTSNLNAGKTLSCGCLMKEINRDRLLSTKIWLKSPANKKGTKCNRPVR